MSQAEKKSAVRVFEEHEKEWTPECIESLSVKVGVQLKDMQNLRVCPEAAEVDPSHDPHGGSGAGQGWHGGREPRPRELSVHPQKPPR
jgi:hypothetical protein